jgi:hypothetical protein
MRVLTLTQHADLAENVALPWSIFVIVVHLYQHSELLQERGCRNGEGSGARANKSVEKGIREKEGKEIKGQTSVITSPLNCYGNYTSNN